MCVHITYADCVERMDGRGGVTREGRMGCPETYRERYRAKVTRGRDRTIITTRGLGQGWDKPRKTFKYCITWNAAVE